MKDNSSHILLYFLLANLCNTRFPSGCWNPPCLCATAWAVAWAVPQDEAWRLRCSPSSQLQDFTFCINGKGVGISSPPNIQNLIESRGKKDVDSWHLSKNQKLKFWIVSKASEAYSQPRGNEITKRKKRTCSQWRRSLSHAWGTGNKTLELPHHIF